MKTLGKLGEVSAAYSRGENLIKYIHGDSAKANSTQDILISYDFQAGSYIKAFNQNPSQYRKYCSFLAAVIKSLGKIETILEVGVGDAITLGTLLPLLEYSAAFGFDIAWSRIKYARHFLQGNNVKNVSLFVGDLFTIPLKDDSADVVYTNHSIEPNGGREEEALRELYRITGRYLVLLEPAFDFASQEAKERMKTHGYVTQLYPMIKKLGYKVIEHRPFDMAVNPLNPTGLTVIEKMDGTRPANPLCCPITKTDLIMKGGAYFSPRGLLAYPIIDGIPCLLPDNAIVATKFMDEF